MIDSHLGSAVGTLAFWTRSSCPEPPVSLGEPSHAILRLLESRGELSSDELLSRFLLACLLAYSQNQGIDVLLCVSEAGRGVA